MVDFINASSFIDYADGMLGFVLHIHVLVLLAIEKFFDSKIRCTILMPNDLILNFTKQKFVNNQNERAILR